MFEPPKRSSHEAHGSGSKRCPFSGAGLSFMPVNVKGARANLGEVKVLLQGFEDGIYGPGNWPTDVADETFNWCREESIRIRTGRSRVTRESVSQVARDTGEAFSAYNDRASPAWESLKAERFALIAYFLRNEIFPYLESIRNAAPETGLYAAQGSSPLGSVELEDRLRDQVPHIYLFSARSQLCDRALGRWAGGKVDVSNKTDKSTFYFARLTKIIESFGDVVHFESRARVSAAGHIMTGFNTALTATWQLFEMIPSLYMTSGVFATPEQFTSIAQNSYPDTIASIAAMELNAALKLLRSLEDQSRLSIGGEMIGYYDRMKFKWHRAPDRSAERVTIRQEVRQEGKMATDILAAATRWFKIGEALQAGKEVVDPGIQIASAHGCPALHADIIGKFFQQDLDLARRFYFPLRCRNS